MLNTDSQRKRLNWVKSSCQSPGHSWRAKLEAGYLPRVLHFPFVSINMSLDPPRHAAENSLVLMRRRRRKARSSSASWMYGRTLIPPVPGFRDPRVRAHHSTSLPCSVWQPHLHTADFLMAQLFCLQPSLLCILQAEVSALSTSRPF